VIERSRAVRISKYLSLVLRHEPSAAGVTLDGEGWVLVDDLLAGAATHGMHFTRAELEDAVATNDKQRFALSEDSSRIRGSQGHSVAVDLGLAATAPPVELYHGTVEPSAADIMATGIQKRSRLHVHLSPDVTTAKRVGARRGRPVVLKVAAGKMHADGFSFYLSANGVWLTEVVPAHYISRLTP
jgi:putative RNA 2'-phosphotransferase